MQLKQFGLKREEGNLTVSNVLVQDSANRTCHWCTILHSPKLSSQKHQIDADARTALPTATTGLAYASLGKH